MEASMTVFVDRSGRICGSRKEGAGSVPLQHLGGMAQCANAVGKRVFEILDAAVSKAPRERGTDGEPEVGASGVGFL